MISFDNKGDFKKTAQFLLKNKDGVVDDILNYYGQIATRKLAYASPKDTGLLAGSWYYQIIRKKNKVELQFCNSDIEDGCPVAIVLQYGHSSGNGYWVEGTDYINPVIQPIFDKIAERAWKEVTKD